MSGIIKIPHEAMPSFLEEAINPSMKDLIKRDKFLEHIENDLLCRMDGSDVVSEIPDLDTSLKGGASFDMKDNGLPPILCRARSDAAHHH